MIIGLLVQCFRETAEVPYNSQGPHVLLFVVVLYIPFPKIQLLTHISKVCLIIYFIFFVGIHALFNISNVCVTACFPPWLRFKNLPIIAVFCLNIELSVLSIYHW